MNLLNIISATRAPSAALGIVGVFWGGFAALMPDIKAQAGASDAAFGMVMMLSAVGSMAAMFIAPRFFDFTGRATLPLAAGALAIATLGPIFAVNVTLLGVAVLITGATVGLLDITGNIRVSAIEAARSHGMMNVAHAMFSFAFGTTALFVAFAREAGFGPAQVLPILSLVAVAMLLLTIEAPANWQAPEAPEDGTKRLGSGAMTVALLTAVVLFCSFVGENSTEAWSALHIERTLGAEVGHGSYGPAVLGFVMGFARLMGQGVAGRVGEVGLILGSAALGIAGALLIAAAWTPNVVLWGVAVVAVGMAVIVPTGNTVLGQRVPSNMRALALSRAWMFGMTGFFVGPSLMGLVAEGFGLRAAYVTIAVVIAALIPASLALGRIPKVNAR